MAVMKLFLLNTFLALQSRGANIDYYATKTTSATNNCSDWNQPCATLWDAIPFKLTNVSHHFNNWLPHGLCSGSYSNQYIMGNFPIESCFDALIPDLLRVFDSTKDKTEAPFTTIPNPMRRIIPVCTNGTISNAKSHSQNRSISLRIVNKHETIDTVYYASGTEQHMRCLMVVLLMFIMCKCPKRISFNTVILMMVSAVLGIEYCNTAYECVGQSRPINRADSLWSRGYKANSGGATDITIKWDSTKYIRCDGSFSCANIGYIKGSNTYAYYSSYSPYLYCRGVFGCSNTTVNLTGTIWRSCHGSNSCYGATFHSYSETASIDCYGDRSCTNTEIHNHNDIRAHGSYALYNATIHSTADGFDVYLYGSNTGFGAAIFCQLGHSCTIYCSATGCNMLYVNCVGNCSIQSNSVDTVLPITEYSLFDESQLNILYDSSALAKSNDADCLLMFDEYPENRYANISGTNVCCRGSWSCDGSSIYSATSVVCSGEESCQSSDNITANDAIFCSASSGCKWSNLYSLNDVYCLGNRACYRTTITARNLYCSGSFSCRYSKILNTETIYFSGYQSGYRAVINCTDIAVCNIICDGYLSCGSIASIHCNECTVSCDRDTGCPPGYTYAPTSDPTPSPTSHPTIPTMIPTSLPTHDGVVTVSIDVSATEPTPNQASKEPNMLVDSVIAFVDGNTEIAIVVGVLSCCLIILCLRCWVRHNRAPQKVQSQSDMAERNNDTSEQYEKEMIEIPDLPVSDEDENDVIDVEVGLLAMDSESSDGEMDHETETLTAKQSDAEGETVHM